MPPAASSPGTGGRLRAFLRSPRGRIVAAGGILVLGVLYLRSRSAAAAATADGTLTGTGTPPGAAIDTGGAPVSDAGSVPVLVGSDATTTPNLPTADQVAQDILGSDYWGTFTQSLADQVAALTDPLTAATLPEKIGEPIAPTPPTPNAPALARTTGVWWNGTYLSSLADLQAYRKSIGAPNATLQTFLYQHPAVAQAIGVAVPPAPAAAPAPRATVTASPAIIRLPAMTPRQVQTAPSPTTSYVVPASPGVPQQVVTVPVVAPPPINVNVRPSSSYIPAAVTHGRGLGGPQA